MRDVEKHFPGSHFENYSYRYNPEPAYFGGSPRTNGVARYVLNLVPERFAAILMVFMRKLR
jgi:hypothetical protein